MGKPYKAIKAMFARDRWRIVEGDQVVIRGTQFSGQIGKVLAVLRDKRVPQVVVEGINLRKKRVPLGETDDDVLVVTMEHPIHYSNVNLVEPPPTESEGNQGTGTAGFRALWPGVRAKFRYNQDGERVRIGKGRHASGRIIPWPSPLKDKPPPGGVKDTDVSEAVRMTRAPNDFQALLAVASSTHGPPLRNNDEETEKEDGDDSHPSPPSSSPAGTPLPVPSSAGSGPSPIGGAKPAPNRQAATMPGPRHASFSSLSAAQQQPHLHRHAPLSTSALQQPQQRSHAPLNSSALQPQHSHLATLAHQHQQKCSHGSQIGSSPSLHVPATRFLVGLPWVCCYGSFAAQGVLGLRLSCQ